MASTNRRDFLATASAATLSALAAGFPRAVARAGASRRSRRPPMPSSSCGWPAGWRTPRRSIRSATRRLRRACARPGAQHVSVHRHGGRPHQVLAGPRAHRRRHGSRHADSQLHGRRPRLHPALAPSVPVAHRLRAAADGCGAAPRRDRVADARAARAGDAGLHQHRPAPRRRRGRRAEGVHDGRVSRHRVRSVRRAVPGRGRRGRAPAGRHVAGAIRDRAIASIAGCSRPARSAGKGASISASRCCARTTTRIGC